MEAIRSRVLLGLREVSEFEGHPPQEHQSQGRGELRLGHRNKVLEEVRIANNDGQIYAKRNGSMQIIRDARGRPQIGCIAELGDWFHLKRKRSE